MPPLPARYTPSRGKRFYRNGPEREDGGFNWLKCNWPPMESDDHYGATVALIGSGAAPDKYAGTAQAAAGVLRLKKYLAANPASHNSPQANGVVGGVL